MTSHIFRNIKSSGKFQNDLQSQLVQWFIYSAIKLSYQDAAISANILYSFEDVIFLMHLFANGAQIQPTGSFLLIITVKIKYFY